MKINIHDQELIFFSFEILASIDYFYSCFMETALKKDWLELLFFSFLFLIH